MADESVDTIEYQKPPGLSPLPIQTMKAGSKSKPQTSQLYVAPTTGQAANQIPISPLSDPDLSPRTKQIVNTGVLPSSHLINPLSQPRERTVTGGKSGRVIERLMNENDRLLREKRLATVQLEEELRRGDSARSSLEALQISNNNMTALHESNAALLLKRDRKIQQYKEDLQAERVKRKSAEQSLSETRKERDETLGEALRDVFDEKARRSQLTHQYETLVQSTKSQERFYRQRLETLHETFERLSNYIIHDKQVLAQMEEVLKQIMDEMERSIFTVEKLRADNKSYSTAKSLYLRELGDRARKNEANNARLQAELTTVLQQMKYLVNIKYDNLSPS